MVNVDEDQVVAEEVIDTEEQIEEEVIEDTEATEQSEEPETIQDEDDDEDDRVVTIGSSTEDSETAEEEEKTTPGWVKKVRKVNRKLESENKRLKRELEAKSTEKEKPVELGQKPTLASCKYDAEAYDKALEDYYERKQKVEDQEAQKARIVEEQNKAYEAKKQRFVEKREEHNFKDFSEAADLVENTFSETQQGIMLEGAEDSALVTYALGKNPKKLEELASMKNPIEFAFALAKMEAQLKVTNRRKPAPERRLDKGKAGGTTGTSDKVLERLREEAARTNDYTKVREYKNKLRKKG